MFQHANIRTPRWLGYLIQRPESHAVHHGRGIHRYNYADLPLWDIIFGTFRNPETATGEVGFYRGGVLEAVVDALLPRRIQIRGHGGSGRFRDGTGFRASPLTSRSAVNASG